MVRLPKPMRREFWFVRNLVQVNLTPAHVVISVGKPRSKDQREETKTATPSTVTFVEGRCTEEIRRFHDCVGGEERAANQRALSPCRWLQTYRHGRKPSAALHATAGLQHIRTVPDLIRRTLELHSTMSGGQVPDTKARFWGDSRYLPVWSSVGAWKMDPATLIAGHCPSSGLSGVVGESLGRENLERSTS